MANRKFWQSYEEYTNDPEYVEKKHNEFAEKLPFASFELATQKSTPRRDFLKMLGFSVSAAAIAASCEQPIRKAIPYVIQPEEITPGVANYYASSFINGNDYSSILVKTREGRPIKIEGNPNSSMSPNGGTDARAQTSVISLYDNARLKNPKINGEVTTWEEIDRVVGGDLREIARQGKKIVLLSSNIVSPTTKKLINEFGATLGNFEHVSYEPISYAGIIEANKKSFGKNIIPSYDFSKANMIVGFEADFLSTWLSPNEFLGQYSKARKISRKNTKMAKHVQFESLMTNTGSNADERYIVKPAYLPMAVGALYNAIAAKSGAASLSGNFNIGLDTNTINKTARQLWNNRGASLVVSGSNDPNVQVLINGINNMLGNYGSTIDLNKPYNIGNSSDEAFQRLIAEMDRGQIHGLLIYNTNPAYSYFNTARFAEAIKKVVVTASFNDREDETASLVKFFLPDNHYLESWNDAEPKKGTFSLAQPCIRPLFNTRQFQDTLLSWMGKDESFYDYLKANWTKSITGNWDKALHDGVYEGKVKSAEINYADTGGGNLAASATSAASAIIRKATGIGDQLELVLYQGLIGDGKYANNPFLQEIPDPVTKVVWENCLLISKATAEASGFIEGDLFRISARGNALELPLLYQPGMADNTLAVAMGYGRTNAGSDNCNKGANVYPLVSYNEANKTFDYNIKGEEFKLARIGGTQAIARTQMHHNINDYLADSNEPSQYDRKEQLVREATLAEYKEDHWAGNAIGKKFRDPHFWDHHMVTLYDKRPELKEGHHWGMAVDLTACTGCNACVAACNIENNVPVVGKEEVFRAHEMHWLRIDRYYIGKDDNPSVAYQPMMCQMCDNAPCENVCPVSATNHSAEGLNQMAYNRCIGTRYCANNCPFKVRRFNWFDYQGADSFIAKTAFDNDENVTLADDLSRMVLNPDVTVRSRGVMEKCSFCVQRIQTGKLDAKKEGRALEENDIKTACQQACSAGAITFGDMNDKNSRAFKLTKLDERSYGLLEELHVLPSVKYLTKIRNTEQLQQDALS